MKRIKKILLVDDDELFNFIHQEIIKNLNIADKIEIAINGKEALKFFEGEENDFPEIVLLDIDMPIMNGFEFLQEINQNYKHSLDKTRIIMLTSSFNQRDMQKAKEFNVSGYLNKPLSVEKFQDILKLDQ